MGLVRNAVLVAALAFIATPVSAAPITLDFEDLVEFTDVADLLDGATFTNAMVLTAGSSVNEFEFPPTSGTNVVYDSASPMRIDFDDAVSSVSAYFTYLTTVTFSAYDAGGNLLDQAQSAFAANFTSSGIGSPNELIQVTSASAISYVTIVGAAFGGSFVLDDLTFNTDPSPVPEPATVSLVLLGVAVAAGRQKLRARRQAHV